MRESGFSLVEIMVVLSLSSVIFLLVYSMISIGVRFLENFSSRVDFSVVQFIRDLEYELERGKEFYVSNRVVFIKGEYNIKYSFGSYDKLNDWVKVRKEIVGRGSKGEKVFYLKNVFEIDLREIHNDSRKKLFASFTSSYGRTLYSGYLP